MNFKRKKSVLNVVIRVNLSFR